jgi:mono/diheme cytochrome c family protein
MRWHFAWIVALVFTPSFWQEPQKAVEEKPAAAAAGDVKTSADAAKLVNPVKPTPTSLASGKKTFGVDCAMCHGKAGAGDGDLASDMKLTLKDFRDPETLKGMSDGEIYTVIEKGKGQMSGEEGRLKTAQIWDVVNYVRSLGKK